MSNAPPVAEAAKRVSYRFLNAVCGPADAADCVKTVLIIRRSKNEAHI